MPHENFFARLAKRANPFIEFPTSKVTDKQKKTAYAFSQLLGISESEATIHLSWCFELSNGFMTIEQFQAQTGTEIPFNENLFNKLEERRLRQLNYLVWKLKQFGYNLQDMQNSWEVISQWKSYKEQKEEEQALLNCVKSEE